MKARKLFGLAWAAVVAAQAGAQVPDLLSAFDAGGRAMAVGGGIAAAGADTQSSYVNPAGLGFITQPQLGVVFRNLPETSTSVEGEFSDLLRDTRVQTGRNSVTHAGIALPLGANGRRGTVGIAYTTGGFINDFAFGNNLNDAGLRVLDYNERLKIRSDFFTLGYGQASGDGRLSYGLSVVVAGNSVLNIRSFRIEDGAGVPRGSVNTTVNETGVGVGAVLGLQWIPGRRRNMSIGLSVRTPIDLTENDRSSSVYDRIPGRATLGIALRQDGIRDGRDFLIYGAQFDGFFGGQEDRVASRKEFHYSVGAGLEYNYSLGWARIPIRVGFNAIPSGGEGSFFGERNTVTFGLGFRPTGNSFSLDLSFASPNRGNRMDMALGMTYRFKP